MRTLLITLLCFMTGCSTVQTLSNDPAKVGSVITAVTKDVNDSCQMFKAAQFDTQDVIEAVNAICAAASVKNVNLPMTASLVEERQLSNSCLATQVKYSETQEWQSVCSSRVTGLEVTALRLTELSRDFFLTRTMNKSL